MIPILEYHYNQYRPKRVIASEAQIHVKSLPHNDDNNQMQFENKNRQQQRHSPGHCQVPTPFPILPLDENSEKPKKKEEPTLFLSHDRL